MSLCGDWNLSLAAPRLTFQPLDQSGRCGVTAVEEQRPLGHLSAFLIPLGNGPVLEDPEGKCPHLSLSGIHLSWPLITPEKAVFSFAN